MDDIVKRLRSEAANWSATCGELFGEAADEIARLRAAVAAERERCARIVEGEVVHEHYRTWPGLLGGNRRNRSELAVMADAFAAAIRRGDCEQKAQD